MHFVTVMAEPDAGGPVDPQTALHADTIHAMSEFWLFLKDVGPEDGQFVATPSERATTRIAIHGHLRNNPFLPWNGDLQGLPGIRGRQLDLYFGWHRLRGKDTV